MKTLALTAAIALACLTNPVRAAEPTAEAKAAAHQQLMTVARWGMCLLETTPEDKARGIVTSVVMRLDGKFAERYGTQATNIARDAYGDNFVETYYNLAKAEHERLPPEHAETCRRFGASVMGLLK